MGIKRGSIYNTFGDKLSLFIAALEFYSEEVNFKRLQMLEVDGSPIENINKFFEAIANIPPEKKTRGCLISNTVVELAPHDAKVAETLRPILKRMQKAFLNCLNKAVEMGELPKDTDTKALASFLATSTHGLIVTGKSAPDPTEVKRVIDVILSTLH